MYVRTYVVRTYVCQKRIQGTSHQGDKSYWEHHGPGMTCPSDRHMCGPVHVRTGTRPDWHMCGLAHVRTGTCADWHVCGLAHVQTGRCADWHMCGQAHVRTGTCADWHMCGVAHVRSGTYADRHMCGLAHVRTSTFADGHTCIRPDLKCAHIYTSVRVEIGQGVFDEKMYMATVWGV